MNDFIFYVSVPLSLLIGLWLGVTFHEWFEGSTIK